MNKRRHHAPADCPVCAGELLITRKGCLACGTELAGEFASCSFCALDVSDLELLRVFLASRGNLREVEKHLQVSYPTARARFDGVLTKLGINPETGEASEDKPSQPATPQEEILARVASGELTAEVASQLIAGL